MIFQQKRAHFGSNLRWLEKLLLIGLLDRVNFYTVFYKELSCSSNSLLIFYKTFSPQSYTLNILYFLSLKLVCHTLNKTISLIFLDKLFFWGLELKVKQKILIWIVHLEKS